MYAISMTVDVNAQLVAKRFEGISDGVTRVARSRLRKAAQQMVRELRTRPTEPPGPFPFVSLRQQRAVVLGIMFGTLQVPYSRTGAYESAWKIETIPNQGYMVVNSVPYAAIVAGTDTTPQFALHQARWRSAVDAFDIAMESVPEDLSVSIHRVIENAAEGTYD